MSLLDLLRWLWEWIAGWFTSDDDCIWSQLDEAVYRY